VKGALRTGAKGGTCFELAIACNARVLLRPCLPSSLAAALLYGFWEMAPLSMCTDLTSSLDHTLTHLTRLDMLIRREVLRVRLRVAHRKDDEFRGLYVSDEEADALLDSSLSATPPLTPQPLADGRLAALDAAIDALTKRAASLEDACRGRGERLRLERLSQLFGLSVLERDVLVICLAGEIDLKYERLYAFIHDDVTKKRPTVDLLLRLLRQTLAERLAARRWFESNAPLIRWKLVTLDDDPGTRCSVLLARHLKLDERVAGYLLGSDAIDSRLGALAAAVPATGMAQPPPAIRNRLTAWAKAWRHNTGTRPPVLLFHGRYGTGKRAAAQFLADALGRPLLLLQAAELVCSEANPGLLMQLAEREALLTGALLCWCDADCVLPPWSSGSESRGRAFVDSLSRGQVPTVLLLDKAWEPGRQLAQRPCVQLELPETTYAERRAHWAAALHGATTRVGESAVDALAGRFRLTLGQMHDALAQAHTLAWTRDPTNGQPAAMDIDAACRAQVQHSLGALARKLTPRYTWDDIVLPRSQLAKLQLIGTMIRQRPVVYGDWGFDRKLAMGKGVIALFAGSSGTGKTMAAEVIANDLSLDLYKIDLSAVVNKYIGETEKNLERIFREAQHNDAILFFDEADALFGRRSEVKDAHDRYANIETAYLLQRTEEYDGLVILASNLKKNMDEAFVRRLHFALDFPEPEEPERLAIWCRTFPPEAPRADDVDLPFLARKLNITGGNIRNIILTAAFLAAGDDGPVAMRHLIRAAAHELQKMGRLVVEGDFEPYGAMAKP
jgi:AAA+ superfamily predicted ATPase